MVSLVESTSKRIIVKGIVQGVGFRPFVYTLAKKHTLEGTVINNGTGVIIRLEGLITSIDAFVKALQKTPPPLSKITKIVVEDASLEHFEGFEILQSELTCKTTAISPDMALCDACLSEMRQSSDRRHHYFLINCTNCGPRYSIIETLPYDRANTSMHAFKMCQPCEDEYSNPLNRRYHAQPISCHDCGPSLRLYEGRDTPSKEGNDAIEALAMLLKKGSIVAVKGIGGFHLMCDGTNEAAVIRLRERKKRSHKPFAVMFPDIDTVFHHVTCNKHEAELLQSKERPIVILNSVKTSYIAKSVAPDINKLGVMLPYTPLHYLLFEHFKYPVVATSANRSDEPIYRSFEEIRENLNDVVDAIVDVDRDIINAVDDAIVQIVEGRTQILRLGRGFAPMSMPLPFAINKKILAVGAQQKSAIALAFDDTVILSPHIGDLGSIEAFEYFERTVETFKRFYDFEPDLIVCDQHPSYMSSAWARNQKVECLEVQHHYAHLLACMLEQGLDEKVLAFSFDGTGYGSDGTIWGGEVMIADYENFLRIGHLEPFRLLGSEKAIKEPRRMALSILFECYGDDIFTCKLPLLEAFETQEIELLYQAWQKGLNAPLTSSIGRLFDAVASLMGVLHVSSYEGQSGLLIESYCDDENALAFHYEIDEGVIDVSPMIRQIVTLVLKGKIVEIADRFINTLVEVMDDFSSAHPELPIVFTGGVFQNKTLLGRALKHFRAKGRRCYVQEHTPINDGAIALGQIAYALYQQRRES